MKTNTRGGAVVERTFEGGPTVRTTDEQKLRRSVLSTMLFEDTFYEDGQTIADRIASLAGKVDAQKVAGLAVEARTKFKLRHAPLWLINALFHVYKTNSPKEIVAKGFAGQALAEVVQRPDELAEMLAMWWKQGKRPIPNQMKKGLAKAFTKFSAYQLAKYNRQDAIKLKDVLFMVHAKPQDAAQAALWKQLIDGSLATPDTWEVAISATKGNKDAQHAEWTRLLEENKLGALALLRNLRNILQAGVPEKTIRMAIKALKTDRVFPYRFLTAARYAPSLSDALEEKMMECVQGFEKLPGKTMILVDVSGSMNVPLSSKTETTRMEAAAGLAILAREMCEQSATVAFATVPKAIPAHYRGLALQEQILKAARECGGSTQTGRAVEFANTAEYDRILIITDEQAHDSVGAPKGRGYIMNVSPHTPSIGYGKWTRIDGWSEVVLQYVREVEAEHA